jgi:WASH complex subunit strumpellin
LSCALDVMNNAVINDVKAHYSRPDSKAYPANPILPNISKYLDVAGINNPITKIYMTTDSVEGLPVLMFLFVLAQMNKLQFDGTLSTLTCKDKKVASAPTTTTPMFEDFTD